MGRSEASDSAISLRGLQRFEAWGKNFVDNGSFMLCNFNTKKIFSLSLFLELKK